MRIMLLTVLILLNGCSLLLPYSEHKLCERGASFGVCGRVSAVYEDTVRNPEKYSGVPECVKRHYMKESLREERCK